MFVASSWARRITGETICVNGGRAVYAPTFAQEYTAGGPDYSGGPTLEAERT